MNAAALYQETAVTTQNSGKLIVLLYNGAISFLRKAQQSITNQDVEGRSRNINCARDIIMELNNSLNLEQGGQTAQNLRSLYNYLWRYLGDVNIKNDLWMLDKVINMLDQLGQAWKKIVV